LKTTVLFDSVGFEQTFVFAVGSEFGNCELALFDVDEVVLQGELFIDG
jgi:hypothetical protein